MSTRFLIAALLGASLGAGPALLPGAGHDAHAVTVQQVRDRGFARIAIANEIPYGYPDLSGKASGVGPETIERVMKGLGIKRIEWTTTSFGSLIPGLKAGRFDMVAAEMAILPQRCKEVLFSEPNSSYGEGLLVPKGNPQSLHSFEQFAKGSRKIAIMAGADQLEILQALKVPQANILTIQNNADAIATVSAGRASAYAATSLTVSQLARKSKRVEAARPFTDPVVDGQPVRSWGGYAFARDSETLRDAVDAELAKVKRTEPWRRLMRRHGFTDNDLEQSFARTTRQLCSGG